MNQISFCKIFLILFKKIKYLSLTIEIMITYKYMESPVGKLLIVASNKGLKGIWFQDQRYYPQITSSWKLQNKQQNNIFLESTITKLSEYFKGFDIILDDIKFDFTGTPFQKSVWKQLLKVPYGQTVTYGEIGTRIGSPKAARAVGSAVGRNPVCVLIPCHRVIGTNGNVNGFSACIKIKQFLLNHEKKRQNKKEDE